MQCTKDVVETQTLGQTASDPTEAVMALQSTPDGAWVAAALSTGVVSLFRAGANSASTFRPFGLGGGEVGLTGLAFAAVTPAAPPPSPQEVALAASPSLAGSRPFTKAGSKGAAVAPPPPPPAPTGPPAYLTAIYSTNGKLRTFNVSPGVAYDQTGDVDEAGNEVLAAGFSHDAKLLVSGGSDKTLRIYQYRPDAGPTLQRTIIQGIDSHGAPAQGHNSRIFAVKFISDAAFVSAGWGSSALLYDTRVAGAVPQRVFNGPRVSGDGIDVIDGVVATASERTDRQLQFFDLASGRQIGDAVTLDSTLFALRLVVRDEHGLCAWVAGNNGNQVACVSFKTRAVVSSVRKLPSSMFAVDINPDDSSLLHAGGSGLALYRLRVEDE